MQIIYRLKVPLNKVIDESLKKIPAPVGQEARINNVSFERVSNVIIIDIELLKEQPKDTV